MATTTRDRFDDIPADLVRVGAHRAPAKRGRGWIRFAWAALATGVLILAGLFGLSRIDPNFRFELPDFGTGGGAEPGESPGGPTAADPVTDPSQVDPALPVSFSILNGSPTDRLQDAAVTALQSAGWENIGSGNASARDQEQTTIYYNGADYEGIARGVAEILGTDPERVVNTDIYPGYPITVVLGADFTPES